ncbi:hypothetical protein PGT21_034658 [Puccinia graminis f. sp. tritici]|uniref:Uncharacterized protein n=1 Tax=Puccinia graminis f. sp. tritici TaxID=56615 RepID=A0A5B0RK47_PUCGR|nr:hypothetical protein PGT21_034658 [Puccinia graminis f. sp. tritici]KAA1125672.1 hypothetical protein PGTUg99_019596 [Puccinia graminis f. sp. tritici]
MGSRFSHGPTVLAPNGERSIRSPLPSPSGTDPSRYHKPSGSSEQPDSSRSDEQQEQQSKTRQLTTQHSIRSTTSTSIPRSDAPKRSQKKQSLEKLHILRDGKDGKVPSGNLPTSGGGTHQNPKERSGWSPPQTTTTVRTFDCKRKNQEST